MKDVEIFLRWWKVAVGVFAFLWKVLGVVVVQSLQDTVAGGLLITHNSAPAGFCGAKLVETWQPANVLSSLALN